MTSALELRQVSKVYGSGPTEVHALRDVDLSVERGELVAIMGPSGSGKSTLLTIAGSLEEATSGQVLVDGVDLATVSRSDRARMRRRSIGYVFQDFNLLPGLTAVENVTLPLELDGIHAKAARAAGLEAMEELDVADHADRYADELSGGERQRVAIARAIVGERGLLLADEPTGALDSVNGESVMRLLRAATKRGVAGVVVTHEAQLASWADRVVFLRDGRCRRSDGRTARAGVAPRCRSAAMTTLAHRPAARGPSSGGIAARRPLMRWAWRLFRREWRQQILVLALLTVAVAAAIASVTIAYNSGPTDDAEFGSANHLLRFDGADPRRLEAGLAAVEERFGTIDVIGHRSLAVPGGVDKVEFRAQDPHGAYGGARLALRRGSYPKGPGQVAVTDGVATILGLELGKTLALDGRRRTVVGIVENPRDLSDEFALVSPSSAGAPDHVTVLVDAGAESVDACSRRRRRRPVRLRRVRRSAKQPGGRRAGDVLGGHRLPAPGHAGRRRRLRRHRAATAPPARHARGDRRDREAPSTRAADQRRGRRRDRRADRNGRGSRALARGRPDARARGRPSHRPAQPALAAAGDGRPRRRRSGRPPPPGGRGERWPASPSRSPSRRDRPGRSPHTTRPSSPRC